MKTDPIFYSLFKQLPSSFFELIGRPASEALNYRFDSVELKQTAFRIDGLFVPVVEDIERPVYFVEVQFRRDPKVYSGLFAEIFVYLHQNNPAQDWRAVVIYETRSQEPTEVLPYEDLLNSFKVTRVYLDELTPDGFSSIGLKIIQLMLCEENIAPEIVRELRQRTEQEVTEEQTRIDVLKLIDTVIVYKFVNKTKEELAAMFGVDDIKQTRLYREISEEVKEEAKLEFVKSLLREGEAIEKISRLVAVDIERVREISRELEQEQN